jgi:threonine/homoserine/homoserine lactone efflux protein
MAREKRTGVLNPKTALFFLSVHQGHVAGQF